MDTYKVIIRNQWDLRYEVIVDALSPQKAVDIARDQMEDIEHDKVIDVYKRITKSWWR